MYRPDCPGYFLGLLFLISERLCPSPTPTLGTSLRRFVTGEKELLKLKHSIHVQDPWDLAWSVVNQDPPVCRLVHHHASFLVANAAQAFINSRRRSNRSVLK